MTTSPRIAIDAMGGDEGVRVMIAGAALARHRHESFKFLLVGDEVQIKAALENHPNLRAASEILHTTEVVTGDDKPSQALRKSRGSSMGLAINAVKAGDAAAAVSAGNTGALMAMAKVALRTMPGIDRPGLLALDDETRGMIAAHGLRNGCLTSIAPTGTTSLLAGNVSSGIEPVFAYQYNRRILQPDGSVRYESVEDQALHTWQGLFGAEPPPEALFVSAQTLAPADHVAMQAAAQRLIDSSISKTVNCPEDIAFEAFSDVYREGYRQGCKGMTTYRPNSVTGSVLSTAPPEKPVKAADPDKPLPRF